MPVHQPGLCGRRGGAAAHSVQIQPLGRAAGGGPGEVLPGRGGDAPPCDDKGPAILSLGQPEVQIPCNRLRLPVSGGAGVLHPPPAHEEGHGPPREEHCLHCPGNDPVFAAVSGRRGKELNRRGRERMIPFRALFLPFSSTHNSPSHFPTGFSLVPCYNGTNHSREGDKP